MLRRSMQGFTVPELLVAIFLLLGMLAGSAFLLRSESYALEMQQANVRTNMAHIAQALRRYQHATGTWPPGITETATPLDSSQLNLCEALVPAYIDDLPLNPLLGGKVTADGTSIPEKACSPDAVYTANYALAQSADGKTVTLTVPTGGSDLRLTISK